MTIKKTLIQNKKARYNYNLHENFEAGLVLIGSEVKSLRIGNGSLDEAFALIKKNEIWIYHI